jgi:hypothetical protein
VAEQHGKYIQTQDTVGNSSIWSNKKSRFRLFFSRSANRTPNFTNLELFVYFLFEYFFQIKV